LQGALRSNNKATDNSGNDYPYDVAVRHYRFAIVDYFRFVLGRFWKTATLETGKYEGKREQQKYRPRESIRSGGVRLCAQGGPVSRRH